MRGGSGVLKRFISLALVCVLMLSFCSCGFISIDLANSLAIECIGVDYEEESEEYNVSILLLNTFMSAASPENISNENITKTFESSGKTVGEAFLGFEREFGKNLIITHNRLIIIGRAAAEHGLDDFMDVFVRNHSSRVTVPVAIAHEKAKDVVGADYGKGVIGAKLLAELLVHGQENSVVPETIVYKLINVMNDRTSSNFVPVIMTEETGEGDEKTTKASIGTAAVFREGKMVGVLSEEATKGYLFITDNVHLGELFIIDESDKKYMLSIVKSKTKINMEMKDGLPNYKINVECICDITENDKTTSGSFTNSMLEDIVEVYTEKIKGMMVQSLQGSISDYGSDIFRFGRRLWLKYPDLYSQMSGNWQEEVKSITTEINVSGKIRLLGEEAIHQY